MDIEPNPQRGDSVAHSRNGQPNPPSGRSKLNKKWSPEETSALLKRLVEGGRIRKRSEVPTHWNLISQDIESKCGTIRSEDECRRRYDTLLKAYKKLKKTGKPYSDITGVERRELNLATPLSEEWYNAVDLQRRCDNGKSRKRPKVDPSDGKNMVSSSPHNPRPPPIPSGSAKAEKSSGKRVAIPGFSALDEDLRSTLLILIQAVSMKFDIFSCPRLCKADDVCQWLAVVQDQIPSDICRSLFKLWQLKLMNFYYFDEWVAYLDLSKLRVHKKFLEEELCKYPDFDMYLQVCDKYDSAYFPTTPLSLSMQRIRVLSLYGCEDVEHADLSNFPKLRSLSIERCGRLKEVTGWEDVKDLGWLSIHGCGSYVGFPCVQFLPSLGNFRCDFGLIKSLVHEITRVRDFSRCVRLRSLEIVGDKSLASVDVSTLSVLEVLTLEGCSGLMTIQGLSGLHLLTKLDLTLCKAMRGVPELGCLKALTHLDLRESGVEEIAGVQELHSLTSLDLYSCRSLKTLPYLGHLKALAHLNISESGVEEIPGVEDLISLEALDCNGSRLKRLPDLDHLPRLPRAFISNTPFTIMDPSSFYYGKSCIVYTPKKQVNCRVTMRTRMERWMTQNPSI